MFKFANKMAQILFSILQNYNKNKKFPAIDMSDVSSSSSKHAVFFKIAHIRFEKFWAKTSKLKFLNTTV